MKKAYKELEITLLSLASEDVITVSSPLEIDWEEEEGGDD